MALLQFKQTIKSGGELTMEKIFPKAKYDSTRILASEIIKFTKFEFEVKNQNTIDEEIDFTSQVNVFTEEQMNCLRHDLNTLKKSSYPEQSLLIDRITLIING